MTTFNLNCFLSQSGNTAQTGGTWTYGTIPSGTTSPSGWNPGANISPPSALNITDYLPGSYPFIYTLTSGTGPSACTASQTYTLNIPNKIVLGTVSPVYKCFINSTLNSTSITVPITYTGGYSWSATNITTGSPVGLSSGSGSGMGNGNITLNIDNSTVPTNNTTPITFKIRLIVNISTSIANTTCITNSNSIPAGVNNCGDYVEIDVSISPNFWAGTGKSIYLCSNNLTIADVEAQFENNAIIPTGGFIKEYYLVQGSSPNQTQTPINTLTNYTLPTSLTQPVSLRKKIKCSLANFTTCESYVDTNVSIITGVNSGNSITIQTCNA